MFDLPRPNITESIVSDIEPLPEPEPPDYQHIFVAGGLGVLGAAAHGKAFRLGKDHIVLEYRIDIRGKH